MRREELYLRDIMEAAEAVESFIGRIEEGGFIKDDLTRSAVLQKLIVIGGALPGFPRSSRTATRR
jgi:uncharacterized protein with HEPN domain